MYCTGCNSDTDDDRGPFNKGGGKSGSAYNEGITYYYHNTLLQQPAAGKTHPMGAGWGPNGVETLGNFVSRNNIWHIHKITDNPGLPDFWSISADCNVLACSPPTPDNGPAVDYDVFNGRIQNAGPNAEMNAVSLGWGAIGGNASKVPTYLAGNGSYPTAVPSDSNNWTGDLRLAASSLGTSNVPLLPNFNDLDGTRHVGAQPPNQSEMKFGRAAATQGGGGGSCSQPPTASFTATPSSGNAPLAVAFNASASSAVSPATIASYSINYGDGTPNGSGVTQNHTYASNGSFVATLVVTDSNGCQSAPDTETITVGSPPPNSVTLMQGQNGYAGTTDTKIASAFPTTNFGNDNTYELKGPNSIGLLVRFNIFARDGGPVPDNATITSATLSFYKYWGPSATFSATRLKKSWTESGANWNVTGAGQSWATTGARGVGTDIESSADGQAPVGDAQADGCSTPGPWPPQCWLTINVTSGVQAFSPGTTPNYGWKIVWVSGVNPSNAHEFNSSENGNWPTLRPTLTVTWQ
jgi:PKD repeat protein